MFITEHAFGELVEACLAINLGYLALERFRYREAIKRLLATADSHLEGMPDSYKDDKAWEDLSNIRQKPGPDAQSIFLHFIYQKMFSRGFDRGVAMGAAIVAFVTLAVRATSPTFDSFWLSFPSWSVWLLFLFLVATTILSAILIKVGQRCVQRVAMIVTENIRHLAGRYVKENKVAADKMVAFVRELQQHSF